METLETSTIADRFSLTGNEIRVTNLGRIVQVMPSNITAADLIAASVSISPTLTDKFIKAMIYQRQAKPNGARNRYFSEVLSGLILLPDKVGNKYLDDDSQMFSGHILSEIVSSMNLIKSGDIESFLSHLGPRIRHIVKQAANFPNQPIEVNIVDPDRKTKEEAWRKEVAPVINELFKLSGHEEVLELLRKSE